MPATASIVKFFEFETTEQLLANLLTQNVNPLLPAVNILALDIAPSEKKESLNVSIRVGVNDPTSAENLTMTNQFIINLKSLCIKYHVVDAVMIYDYGTLVSTTPGVFRKFISLAYCNHIKISQFFQSEGTPTNDVGVAINMFVNKPYKFLTLVQNFDLVTADTTLCVNTSNVGTWVQQYGWKCHCKKTRHDCKPAPKCPCRK